MTVKGIIEKYLRDNGFDGLYEPCERCACEINDLFPCGEYIADCKPGYKRICDKCKDEDCDIRGETTACIGEEKHL